MFWNKDKQINLSPQKEDIENTDIYSMELHEVIDITEFLAVRRVPGGWLFKYFDYPPVFVLFNNEFQGK